MFLNSPYRPRQNLVKTTNPNRINHYLMRIYIVHYAMCVDLHNLYIIYNLH